MSLRKRVLLLFLAFAVLPVLLLGVGDYAQSVRALQDVIQTRATVYATDRGQDIREAWLELRQRLDEWAVGASEGGIRGVPPGFSSVRIVGPGGETLSSVQAAVPDAPHCPGATGRSFSLQTWFANGNEILEVAGEVPVRTLVGLVPALQSGVGQRGETYLVDPETGDLLYGAGCSAMPPALASALAEALEHNGSSGVTKDLDFSFDRDRKHAVMAQATSRLAVLTTVAPEEYIGLFRSIRIRYLVAVAILLAGAALGVYLLLRTSFQSLERLARAADEVEDENMNVWLPPPGEDEVGRLSASMAAMIERLSQSRRQMRVSKKMAAVGELASYLSHEIRNPLSSIKLSLQSLRRDLYRKTPPEDFLDVIELCIAEVQRLDGVVHTVLEVGRSPTVVHTAVCSVNDVVEEAVQLLSPKLVAEEIRTSVRIQAHNDVAYADGAQLKGVLINLILNAAEAVPEDGERLVELETRNVSTEHGPQVEIEVRDSGCGVPPHLREEIFEPFFTTKPTGSGIGLSTSLRIVQQWGGVLELRQPSELRAGAVFVIRLQALGADARRPRRDEPDDRTNKVA